MGTFNKIYEEYARPVHGFLLRLTRNEELAEELLQETFYQALQHIDQFEGRCSLYTWLCQIGKNAWYKECRRSRRYSDVKMEDLIIADTKLSVEEQIVLKDEFVRVQRAIQKLDEPYKDVFILHAIGEVKLVEIAAVYEKSESWARMTFFRAKQRIVQEVQR